MSKHLFSHFTNYTDCQNNHIYLSIFYSSIHPSIPSVCPYIHKFICLYFHLTTHHYPAVHFSIYLSISIIHPSHPSVHSPVHSSIYPRTTPAMYSIYLSIIHSFIPSVHKFTRLFVRLPTHHSIYLSFIHSSIHPSRPSVHSPFCPSTQAPFNPFSIYPSILKGKRNTG